MFRPVLAIIRLSKFLTSSFFLLKFLFEIELLKQRRLLSVPNHKLSKNECLGKICSVFL